MKARHQHALGHFHSEYEKSLKVIADYKEKLDHNPYWAMNESNVLFRAAADIEVYTIVLADLNYINDHVLPDIKEAELKKLYEYYQQRLFRMVRHRSRSSSVTKDYMDEMVMEAWSYVIEWLS